MRVRFASQQPQWLFTNERTTFAQARSCLTVAASMIGRQTHTLSTFRLSPALPGQNMTWEHAASLRDASPWRRCGVYTSCLRGAC
jgi:hypothetical protein